VKSEQNCTAMKMAAKSSHVAVAEGAELGRSSVVFRYEEEEDGIGARITVGRVGNPAGIRDQGSGISRW
jgi:hypothetical protein